MKTMLLPFQQLRLALALLASLAVSPLFAQTAPGPGEGLDPFDPALLTGLLPDDEYAPTVTAVGASGAAFVVSWKADGILQVSDGPAGPWKDLWNASSPFSLPLSDAGMFLRVRIPGANEIVPVDQLVTSPLDRFYSDLASVGFAPAGEPVVIPRVTVEASLATRCPATVTRCPPGVTHCPATATACPPAETKCPSVETVCPASETKCPPTRTRCPVVQTRCPVGETRCPASDTRCPATDTHCPAVATQCPSGETFCPAVETRCPAALTKCPAAETRCPAAETRCPSGETFCPAVETAVRRR